MQKGATKRSGAIKKNLQMFNGIFFQGISTHKKVQLKEVLQLKRACKISRKFHFEAYSLAKRCN